MKKIISLLFTAILAFSAAVCSGCSQEVQPMAGTKGRVLYVFCNL